MHTNVVQKFFVFSHVPLFIPVYPSVITFDRLVNNGIYVKS